MNAQNATPAGLRVNTIVLAFTLVSGMTVFLRMFSRIIILKSAGFEDVCIGFAMVLAIALAVLTAEQVMNGLGAHSSKLELSELDTVLKAFWASVWIYNLTLTVTKVSILVQYLKIFPIRRFRKACFGMLGIVVGYGAWAVASSVFICSPVSFSWDISISDGHCMNQLVVWVANAGVNIAQDLVIFIMPLFVVRTLQIPQGQKKGLVLMFALGASVTLVSIIRLYSLDEVSDSSDVSFDNPAHATLSAVEVNVGIISACLPAMRPLFALLIPQYFSATPQYTDNPVLDIEHQQPGPKKQASTGTNTAQTNTPRTATPRATTPRTITPRTDSARDMPLQALKPTLSRTPSGRFSVTNSRPPTPRLPSSQSHHSRTASNTSANSTKPNARFQGRVDPLRMSPIIPFSPPLPGRTTSPLAPGAYTRRPSNVSTPAIRPPRTPGADKQLPVTPFPVGPGD